MTLHRALRNAAVATLLLTALAAPAAARTRAARPEPARVATLGERLWHLVVRLLPGDWNKEGVTIDPNGRTGATTSATPVGGLNEEGTSIDPNGRM